jgi:hypothetical protein
MTPRHIHPVLLSLLLAPACLPKMDDNSIGTPGVVDFVGDGETQVEETGDLAVAPGDADGDWTFAIGKLNVTYHSPSRADLSILGGKSTLTIVPDIDGSLDAVVISDSDGVAFAASVYSGYDGRTFFGRSVWTLGDAIGKGTINSEGEADDVIFREVLLAADDGDLVLLPGEPTDATIEGSDYRVTVVAAFETVDATNSKCSAPDTLAIEVLRGVTAEATPVARELDALSPIGSCM